MGYIRIFTKEEHRVKRTNTVLLAAAMCVLSLSVALAQGGGAGGGRGQGRRGMGGFGFGGVQMLTIPEVQKELKLTQDQIDKVQSKQAEVRQSTQEIMQEAGGFQALQSMSAEDRQKLGEKMQAVQTKAVGDILNTDQLKRFKQLEIQQAGIRAFSRKDVKDALKLTTDQTAKITEIEQAAQTAQRDAMQGIDPRSAPAEDMAKVRTKMAEIQKAHFAKAVAVLTPDQQKQWKTLTGDPFTFPARAFGGPGGGRRAPGGAPGAPPAANGA